LVPDDAITGADLFARLPDDSDTVSDLTADGQLDDVVLQVLDTEAASPEPQTLGPAGHVSVAAGAAAFLVPESASGADRNGDGDNVDAFVHLSVDGGLSQDLDREAVAIAMSSELIAALVPSGPSGETFVEIYDWASGSPGWSAVGGAPTDLIDTVGSVVALRAAATEELHIYDGATAALTPLGHAEEFVLGERMIAFRASEAAQGESLNGDGDTGDYVLQVYDFVSRELMNTCQATIPCRFEACDPRIPYRVSGETVTFLTLEADQGGEDLNGDDDAEDIVLQIFNAGAVEEGGAACATPALARAASAAPAAPDVRATLASVSAGLCTDTAEACADDTQCEAGTCFVPPGGCIEELLGTTCTCGETGCDGCAPEQFCVPTGGGAGVCHVNRGPCGSTADCADWPTAVCEDGPADIARLLGPLSAQSDGRQLFMSAAVRAERSDGSAVPCLTEADCREGEVCTDAGTCQADRPLLMSASAPDTDGDGVADPFDNCPHRPNTDQADENGNGVGDPCDLTTLPPVVGDVPMCKSKRGKEMTVLVPPSKVPGSLAKGLTIGECADATNGVVMCKSRRGKMASVLVPHSKVQRSLDKGLTLGACRRL
jgi:hypothetical protein